jgi:hypothetical protein
MSQRLISRSPDLKRLRDEGYEVTLVEGYLLVRSVPYVAPGPVVRRGVLASPLAAHGDVASPPGDHTVRFAGEMPCTADGTPYERVVNGTCDECLAADVTAGYLFSSKPPSGAYPDYYEKMTTYVRILEAEAQALDPSASARTFRLVDDEEESVFCYMDTASSRAGINALSDRFRGQKVAIVGLGGTGSYILDLVAKTPVAEIHLYDGDAVYQHNAFRMPGAISREALEAAPAKVAHLADLYGKLRRGIVVHEAPAGEEDLAALCTCDFVFLALAGGEAKRLLVAGLAAHGVPFVDAGMGVYRCGEALAGQLRVTAQTAAFPRSEGELASRVPSGGAPDEYAANIQIADLNALNAALAVIRWKKHCGFYLDLEGEHFSVYEIDGNHLLNEDCARP